MVEVFWYSASRDGVLGVEVVQSTAESNRTGQYGARAVYWIPGASCSSIFGHQTGLDVGLVSEVFRAASLQLNSVYASICAQRGSANIYHAWVGYAQDKYTADHYHCCDWYIQGPDRILSGIYSHFLLLDVYAPDQYYCANLIAYEGTMYMEDGDPGREARRMAVIAGHLTPAL